MNISIFGYGRMGKIIDEIAKERGHNIISVSNSKNPATKLDISNADVVIDFSIPSTAYKNICYALEQNIPVISGTTNWLDKLENVKEICLKNNSAFLYSSNFSLSMNIVFEINKNLAKLMNKTNYECSINEIHHINKLDSPSGTAVTLKNDIINILKKNISIKSERISDEIGTHEIIYKSENDIIELKHKANNRKGFGLGAVIAAEWIINKKGCFTLSDILNDNLIS